MLRAQSICERGRAVSAGETQSIGSPYYKEIKLRKEGGLGRRPLNTRGAKLSEAVTYSDELGGQRPRKPEP